MTNDIVNDTIAFHTSDTMLDMYADSRNAFVFRLFFGGQCAFWWFLLWLHDGYSWQAEALECAILCQLATFGQLILRFVRNPFVMRFPFIGGTQKADIAGLIDYHHIFDRVIFLFAAVVDSLFLVIQGSCYRPFGAIMIKRGADSSSRAGAAWSWAANSDAVRAGSKC
jgi:hypothetical protein